MIHIASNQNAALFSASAAAERVVNANEFVFAIAKINHRLIPDFYDFLVCVHFVLSSVCLFPSSVYSYTHQDGLNQLLFEVFLKKGGVWVLMWWAFTFCKVDKRYRG